ncbi:MAG: DHH family phosphoesterase [Desulfamplus sp.]|nr:DHH family phosphoesterase [Desulfamplus sp.]
MRIKERTINQQVYTTCLEHGYPEIVARIIAGRTDTFDKNIFQFTLDAIKPADIMADCTKAAKRIAQAINNNETILIFTDYDVDGCTSMAVLYGTLHDVFGVPDSRIIRLTGHRILDGYGLTDPVADKILSFRQGIRENLEEYHKQNLCHNKEQNFVPPTLVITADAGASDGARIKRLADAGIDVIVTDHHIIPKEGIPEAAFAVVNPKRENCPYDSDIAGCGVAWLLMTALSKEMANSTNTEDSKRRGVSNCSTCTLEQKQKIHQLLDHVALGTIADLVPLTSVINRYFVKKGLEFMNRRIRPCWQVALNGKDADNWFLAFQLAPRINASSRMTSEATTALDFLIKDDPDIINQSYQQLGIFNSDRQKIEKEMFNAAKDSMGLNQYVENSSHFFTSKMPSILIYYSENNHPGIQGIVAGKLTENFGIPAIMIADIENGFAAGSGRAGQFLHLRDALQTFDERFPGILIAYGGHRAAAGFKLRKDNIDLLKKELPTIVVEQLDGQDITPYLHTDGSLKNNNTNGEFNSQINLETYYHIEALHPFGMGFPSPLFHDQMRATDVKVMGKNPVHLSMMLDGVKSAFFYALDKPGAPLPLDSGDLVDVVYTLSLNSWQGRESLQLIIKKILPPNSLIAPMHK